MLGLPEFRANSVELYQLNQKYEALLQEALEGVKNKRDAIKIARSFVTPYQIEYRDLLQRALMEIALNAATHYESQLGTGTAVEAVADEVVTDQFQNKYYGMTLRERLAVNERRLDRIMVQTAQVGIDKLPGVFTERVPFGAQYNVDKRILQGTAIKIEQDTAKKYAEQGNIDLVTWKLAPRHTITCQCEAYASHISQDVVDYIKKHNLDISPRGVWFANQLPDPPHPNCQCEYRMVTEKKTTATGRAISKILSIIRRLVGKR